ncbi:MAG: hypothetical protein ACRDFS_08870 [Chloroflexota bacterium]
MPIEFRRYPLIARSLSSDGSKEIERRLERRIDPLLGYSSRIVPGVKLPVAEESALEPLRRPNQTCPFCPGQLQAVTPRFPPEIVPQGRIRLGQTTVVPNIVPYCQYAAVAVFTPRHWLDLPDFTPRLLADNLNAVIDYIRLVAAIDEAAAHASYNINYLYPSGGSLPHPHAQVYLDRYPTNLMREVSMASAAYREAGGYSYWDDLAAREETGPRFIGRTGSVSWMAPFAPMGFNEVRGIVDGTETILGLDAQDVADLADGISRILAGYHRAGYNSFNLALYSGRLGGEPGYRVNLSMITRSALVPYYRSDAMYLERLHAEAAVDRPPEEVVAEMRPSFEG